MSDFPITPAYVEPNPIVADGSHQRVFVRELQIGDVDPFGAVVVSISHGLGNTTKVLWDNQGVESCFYRNPLSTTLIRTR